LERFEKLREEIPQGEKTYKNLVINHIVDVRRILTAREKSAEYLLSQKHE
jgi:hypothetical protein